MGTDGGTGNGDMGDEDMVDGGMGVSRGIPDTMHQVGD